MIPGLSAKEFQIPDPTIFKKADLNFHCLEEKDIDLDVIIRVSNFIQSNTSLNNQSIEINKVNLKELKEFEKKLENKIREIKSETTGFLAFFRYLFQQSLLNEKTTLAESMKRLKEFIGHIKPPLTIKEELETRVFKRNATKVETQQETDKAEEREEIKPPKEEYPAPTAQSPLPATSLQERLDPSANSSPSPQPQTSEDCSTPSSPSPTGGPPPPPPMMGGAKRLFENEPAEPTIKLPGTPGAVKVDKLTLDQLRIQIALIETYLNKLKNVLGPIATLVDQEKKTAAALKNDIPHLALIQSQIKDNEKKERILNGERDVAYVLLEVKTGVFKKTPCYSAEAFKKRNEALEKMGRPKIDPKFLQSEALKPIKDKLEKLRATAGTLEKKIKKQTATLGKIKSSKNNNFPFDQFSVMLDMKDRKIMAWETLLRACKSRLNVGSAPKKEKKASPKHPVKPNFGVFITSPLAKELKDEYPDLEILGEFYQDQNAQILLNDKEFHNKLTAEND